LGQPDGYGSNDADKVMPKRGSAAELGSFGRRMRHEPRLVTLAAGRGSVVMTCTWLGFWRFVIGL